jgi:amino acid adenylation domain-containing protein
MEEGSFRCSPQQRRLWSIERLGARLDARAVAALSGELRVDLLERALAAVVERHEVLRTRLVRERGLEAPVQVIDPPAAPELRRLDRRAAPAAAVVEQLLEEGSAAGRERAERRSFSAALAATPSGPMLLLALPASSADRRGLELLIAEVARAYGALTGGGEPAQPLCQYPDLAEWMNQMLAEDRDEALAAARSFWRRPERAPGRPLASAPRADAAPFSPRRVALELGPARWDGLRSLAARLGVPPWALLLAAFRALVGRLQESPAPIGFGADGRALPELAGALGLLTRFLPLAVEAAPGEGLGSAARKLVAAAAEARVRQEAFGWEWEDEGPSPAFLPFGFEVVDEGEPHEAAGVTFRLLRSAADIDLFALKLAVAAGPGEPWAELAFDPRSFAAEEIGRFAERFTTLLAGALDAPGTPLDELEAVGPAERSLLTVELNRTAAPCPARCCHELFADQAARTPTALAAGCGGEERTFGALDAAANRLAWALRRRGAGPEARVAVLLPSSLDLLTALLGVWKAGAAYVPLDPALPAERLAFLLGDCGADLTVSLEALAARFPGLPGRFLLLDRERGALERESPAAPAAGAVPENLAYVLYTSGSTGAPKGVLVPHRGLVNYLSWCIEAYGVAAGAGAPVHSSPSFDLTLTALFAPLLAGRRVELLPSRPGVESLAAALASGRDWSFVKLTPSHLALLAGALGKGAANGSGGGRMRTLVVGGESLPAASLSFFRDREPGLSAVNEYGPTETVIGCSFHRVGPGDPWEGDVPIGRPIANARLYVLDRGLRLVLQGARGELAIGGLGVARGYHGRPDLTAERFVPDPFATSPGERLYLSGDLVRQAADGTLSFLGRNDEQLKIRGHRIEPGEIEAALAMHPQVGGAAVLGLPDPAAGPGARRLVACWVAASEPPPATGALRSFLAERLPEAMVPSAWALLPALPLGPSGKVDRRALAALAPPAAGRPAMERVASRNPVEELLAGLWAEVLGVSEVSVDDDFFAAGGHSMLAAQLVFRSAETFAVELPLQALFDAPTLAGFARVIAAAQRGGPAAAPPPLVAVPREGPLPLSFAQERLWFLARLEPAGAAYNIPVALRLAGALDALALERALAAVVGRHEALRTSFPEIGGRPVQVVGPAAAPPLPRIDLSALPSPAGEGELERLAAAAAARPFDLARGPLLAAALAILGGADHALLLTLHHIASDAWSSGILIAELAAFYRGFAGFATALPPPLAVQYADFAVWQRRWLSGEVLARELAYWRRQLGGVPALPLPLDRPRPALRTARGGRLSAALPAALGAALAGLARASGSTLFMALLAAFSALLARVTERHDVPVGSPIANRSRPETAGLIGLFVNTLVLRTDLSGDPSFRELMARVRAVALAAYAHQEVPFERLVEELRPPRDLSRTPLFQVALTLAAAAAPAVGLPGLALREVEVATAAAKFDWTLALAAAGGGLAGELEYDADLYDAATVERLLRAFESLLAAAVADPDRRLGGLPLHSAAEALAVVAADGAERRGLAAAGSLDALFFAQAARAPTAEAVTDGARRLTYGELARRAARLARRLRAMGVGPEARVALCAGRSVDLVVGVLGILKSGGAYVPLDPRQPRERLRWIAADSGAVALVGEEGAAPGLAAECGLPLVPLAEEGCGEAGGGEAGGALPGNLAYVIYTSGSTGRPKGVAVEHRQVVRLLAAADWFGFGRSDTWTLFHSFAFDFSVWEVWGALALGGRLVVVDGEVSRSPEAFRALLVREGVTVLNQTPSAFRALLDADEAAGGTGLAGLRFVIFGGEALDLTRLGRWFARYGGAAPRLVNMYGITETTVHVTLRPLASADAAAVGSRIGRPLPDLEVHLLDREGEPVPAGVPGEIYVGGDGLARGYLGRPERTAERFVPNPWAASPGQRLYRSGDLARRRPDGDLEYLGRLDGQVKVRGFRIELGEVEAALAAHPAVRQAVVVAREDAPDDRRLVGYVVVAAGGEEALASLRPFLRQRLPEPMVPAAIVPLRELPLTPNGKVDRRGLPPPGDARPVLEVAYVAPRTAVEERLAAHLRQALGLARVGLDDNFFDLGGHSLLLVRVHSRLREDYPEARLIDLFRFPTVRALAAHLDGAAPVAAAFEAVRSRADRQRSVLEQHRVRARGGCA